MSKENGKKVTIYLPGSLNDVTSNCKRGEISGKIQGCLEAARELLGEDFDYQRDCVGGKFFLMKTIASILKSFPNKETEIIYRLLILINELMGEYSKDNEILIQEHQIQSNTDFTEADNKKNCIEQDSEKLGAISQIHQQHDPISAGMVTETAKTKDNILTPPEIYPQHVETTTITKIGIYEERLAKLKMREALEKSVDNIEINTNIPCYNQNDSCRVQDKTTIFSNVIHTQNTSESSKK